MTLPQKIRPGLAHKFPEPLLRELKKIWDHLGRVIIGPWRYFSHEDGLFLQKYDLSTKQYQSAMKVDSDMAFTYRADSSVTNIMIAEVNESSVGAGQLVTTTTRPLIIVPEACTLADVKFAVMSIIGGGPVEGDLYLWRGAVDQGTVLTGQVSIAAAFTTYTGTVAAASASLQAGDILQPRYVTGGGESIADAKVTVKLTKTDTTSGFSTTNDHIGAK